MIHTLVLKRLEKLSGETGAPNERFAVYYQIQGERHERRLEVDRAQLAKTARPPNGAKLPLLPEELNRDR